MDDLIHILLVEDNPTDVLLLRETLAEVTFVRFKLTCVERLDEALQALGEQDFDVVLIDLGLPDSQGLKTLVSVHAQAQNIPVVVLTGLVDEQLGIQALQEGAQDYLIKGQLQGAPMSRSIRYAIERKQAEVAIRAKEEELKTMTQQLWQTAKLATMGELAASIAHEINNPLATVSMRIESLLSETSEGDPRKKEMEIIEQEVDRMADLVANLLQFSRHSAQHISSIDMRQEVENTLGLIDYHLRNHRIGVALEFAPQLSLVHADRQQLRQLFLNLFTNASDAMPQGGTLTVRVAAIAAAVPSPAQITVEIADTGAGIAPEHLAKVREPFFTTKAEGKGTGLGLAICQRIVQEHHGTFDIESEVGVGTTVRIRFPVANGNNTAYLTEE